MPDPAPCLGRTSFICPHCHAAAHQQWFAVSVTAYEKDDQPSILLPHIAYLNIDAMQRRGEDVSGLHAIANKLLSGVVFFDDAQTRYGMHVNNMWLSQCYSCDGVAIWVHERLIHPTTVTFIEPNPDLSDAVKKNFHEALSIVDASPRASCALLRLCVQRLCIDLGKAGNNLNEDIASLVRDGLDQRIQKALDIIRVVGNNAVHPGQIDLQDDRETALTLFRLVNMIAEKTLTEPKVIDEIYATLPESAKRQIERRDR